ncbi:M23 family metallopeptidase [Pedobacter alpinus]|uniref:M23 family metallopeptidase n=1 Tax=Pedobacter alpinus TaxID=1590643 RepID=A0ABW5TSV2_9SPHI
MTKNICYIIVLSLLFITSCKTIFKISPYQSYVESLKSTGLNTTNMGQKWTKVGDSVLSNPNNGLSFPFKEEIFFREEAPAAIAYQISYQKSKKIKISISTSNKNGVFLDFFEGIENRKNITSKHLKDTILVYESDKDQVLLLRLQPQLLINEHVIVEILEQPKLGFPVKNGKNNDIKSFWGMDRDGGERKHEGVDIFNKRGTPIIAVEDGVVSRVQITNLGGKVVWQRLGFAGPSIYYAHLDSQTVSEGQKVKKGEVLGLMGNTGNARTTSPHLHFGIYTSSGAIDPLNYIFKKDSVPGKLKADSKYLGKEIMLTENDQVLPVKILAISTSSVTYQDIEGNVSRNEVLNIYNKKIKRPANPSSAYLLEKPAADGVAIGKFDPTEYYAVLGFKNSFVYLEQNNVRGWVAAK